MTLLRLADFENKHYGQIGYIIGRGPTLFDYKKLAEIDGPVFFINDAVGMEQYLRDKQPSYFFALDYKMKIWLPKIKSIAVLPLDHKGGRGKKILDCRNDPILSSCEKVILWHAGKIFDKSILKINRDQLAQDEQLYVGNGTIHSALHFAWFTGCHAVKFIGCDGFNNKKTIRQNSQSKNGYDARLPNISTTRPWWQYSKIKQEQELVCNILEIPYEYIGTPSIKI